MIRVMAGLTLWLGKLFLEDLQAAAKGTPHPRALPGAVGAPLKAYWLGLGGTILLLGLAISGEYALGVVEQQSDITAMFLIAMLCAGLIEEVLFRGFLVVRNRGRRAFLAGVIGCSLFFAALHVQYYTQVPEGAPWWQFEWKLTLHAGWTLFMLFLHSLWFYAVRFAPWNPARSLLPCFVSHAGLNLGVFLTKLAQGHVTSLW